MHSYAYLFTTTYICSYFIFFFFNDTATTEIYTLSLHDALPIFGAAVPAQLALALQPVPPRRAQVALGAIDVAETEDRKSTRLNSSHSSISYAVFCLKKKTKKQTRSCRDMITDVIHSRLIVKLSS